MPEGEGGVSAIAPEPLKQKAGPLPVWVWGLGLVGAVVVVFVLRSRGQAQAPAQAGTQTIGSAASTDPGTGITSADPLTADQLLSALQDLQNTLSQQQKDQAAAASKGTVWQQYFGGLIPGLTGPPMNLQNGKVVPCPPGLCGVGVPYCHPCAQGETSAGDVAGLGQQYGKGGEPMQVATTHTNGGSSTARLTAAGIPSLPRTRVPAPTFRRAYG